MGALQPGLPLPTMVPEGWPLLIIDLKDCFFTILWVAHLPPNNQFERARESHSTFHQNTRALQRQFGLSYVDAQRIVRTCPQCSHHGPGLG
ncbi:POK25 protein, partial [Rhynochetos jubatus]|nr:POK25 protein [Rhynochetos jubatus]